MSNISTDASFFVNPTQEKPTSLSVNSNNIPIALRSIPHWVVWGWEWQGDKWSKPCLNPRQPIFEGKFQYARNNDAGTWSDFSTALATTAQYPSDIAGVGFVFAETDDFCGIDLDKCRNPDTGQIEDWAKQHIKDFRSYSEVSPSGKGVKLICKASLPGKGRKHGQREIYDRLRYFTITGHNLSGLKTIEDRQNAAIAFYENNAYFPPQEKPIRPERPQSEHVGKDAEIVGKIRADEKGAKLWAGDTSEYGGDDSRADLALCSILAWYCGPEAERIDRLFRDSGLYRNKWERDDYRERTLDMAMDRDDWYQWPCLTDDECREIHKQRNEVVKVAIDEDKEDTIVPPAPAVVPIVPHKPLMTAQQQAQAEVANEKQPAGYRFAPLSSAEFDRTEYKMEWLVRKMLVKNQPTILGGPRKSMKTNLLVELAISLGSGLPFLDEFAVRKSSCCLISGESGMRTLQETARRICRAKGCRLAEVDCWWEDRLPTVCEQALVELATGIKQRKIEVAIIDPLYLMLLAGQDGKNAANLFDTGPLLKQLSDACLAVGATPILAHHTIKHPENRYEPIELEDLAFSGIQEYARQWLLINRRKSYVPDSGHHELWLSAGGSVGHGGLWGVNIEEGQLQEDFTGRIWQAQVMNLIQVKETKRQEKDDKKTTEDDKLKQQLLACLDGFSTPPTKNLLRSALGWGYPKFDRIFALCDLIYRPGSVKIGNGAEKETVIVVRKA